ncbi:MAG TPA: methylmalonyl Co-A mutase-associated GTPase MeaB [Acidimicrobiales bacterium]|nr:methylmalonyl Co-A mutase-associated GTPase MeaB [Acidimicrobiales bacterium]
MTTRLARRVEDLLGEAAAGDQGALARLLSAVERGGGPMREVAALSYRTPPPYTLGLTGAPGAGKSTLTDRLIGTARRGWPAGPDGQPGEPVDRLAVLAVDPTSPYTGGAILGDRVRMRSHEDDPGVFIRSMATRGHLGGLALALPDAVRLLGAAGVPLVVIETVGVGQMEVEVASAADTTVVLVTPGWGDSMQANKAGLLEVADVFVVNKADRPGTREARRDLEQMLDLSHLDEWRPPVLETVASTGEGVDELWSAVGAHRSHLTDTGRLSARRAARLEAELARVVEAALAARVHGLAGGEAFAEAARALAEQRTDPYGATDRLLADVAGAE